jgi:murein DD-endopeptidase MepM/ murein hydrolase activator NlpD
MVQHNPEGDTHPTGTFPQYSENKGFPKIAGLILLLMAVGLTVGSLLLMVTPQEIAVVTVTNTPETAATQDTVAQSDNGAGIPVDNLVIGALPTLSIEARAALLQTPVQPQIVSQSYQIERNPLDPFTIIPDRPRNTMTKYTIQQGDTIYSIAQQFGLSQESIAWSNDRRQIWTLIPGDELNIPPVDGVYIQAVGQSTIRDIAAEYGVSDPSIVLNSEANNLQGLGADSVPPSGTWIFIPGGVAEEVNWSPQIVTGSSSGSSGNGGSAAASNLVGFELGDPGSCGLVEPGAGTSWSNPMAFGTYTITRGFSSWHPGIDMASSTGTAVYAANGGKVIFAGRNSWGYGNTIVISHGPYNTLYGHLSTINVSCGQVVASGQVIGGVGSTGNSSGPHLHFEIMYGTIRSDPAATLAF